MAHQTIINLILTVAVIATGLLALSGFQYEAGASGILVNVAWIWSSKL